MRQKTKTKRGKTNKMNLISKEKEWKNSRNEIQNSKKFTFTLHLNPLIIHSLPWFKVFIGQFYIFPFPFSFIYRFLYCISQSRSVCLPHPVHRQIDRRGEQERVMCSTWKCLNNLEKNALSYFYKLLQL